MEEAARLLRETDGSIGDIAQQVGYENQSKFSQAFRDTFQVLPTEYRRAHGVQAATTGPQPPLIPDYSNAPWGPFPNGARGVLRFIGLIDRFPPAPAGTVGWGADGKAQAAQVGVDAGGGLHPAQLGLLADLLPQQGLPGQAGGEVAPVRAWPGQRWTARGSSPCTGSSTGGSQGRGASVTRLDSAPHCHTPG